MKGIGAIKEKIQKELENNQAFIDKIEYERQSLLIEQTKLTNALIALTESD